MDVAPAGVDLASGQTDLHREVVLVAVRVVRLAAVPVDVGGGEDRHAVDAAEDPFLLDVVRAEPNVSPFHP